MATSIPIIPDMGDQAVQMPANVMDPEYYLFLKQLAAAAGEMRRQLTMITSAVAPTASDIPANETRVWKNTGAGTVRLYVNDGGTLKSVLLS